MKFVLSPIKGKTLYFYIFGLPLLFVTWFDQWLELYLLSDKLRLQLFILAIIVMTCAAIINLTHYIIVLYQATDRQKNRNKPPKSN